MTTKPPPPMPPPPGVPTASKAVKFSKPPAAAGHKIVVYGPGGIGKTSLALLAPGPVVFFDLDNSLPILKPGEMPDVVSVDTWQEIRDALNAPGWDGVGSIIIDTVTRAEEIALDHLLATVKTEKGQQARSIEDYGFGKGYSHLFEVFLPLLGDLEKHTRAGRHVILICHDCVTTCPNPMGDDWQRYEPRLQDPKSGKSSIRLRVREWADHLLFIGYDVAVKGGKGQGSGTRTLYPKEMPHCMAKTRTLRDPIPVDEPTPDLWQCVLHGVTE